MLFTSWVFLLFFFPCTLLGYGLASLLGRTGGALWLVLASIVFYGFFAPGLVILLLCSVLFNYGISRAMSVLETRPKLQTNLLIFGITADLGALFYYKYLFSVLSFLDGIGVPHMHGLHALILPLGISFFTFTQIGFLIDCRAGTTKDNTFLDYILFVTFFPHLVAGPILHHSEMMPQFANRSIYGLKAGNIGAGLTLFMLGLMKKVMLADPLASLNSMGFASADHVQFLGAWGTALGYSMQLYFDFSGYSDMAIGLAMTFNIRFPANFNSPYKARNIIDFWQRWHMTLTRYLTLFLYNPIAMNLRRRRMAKGLPMSRKAMASPTAFMSLVAFPTVVTMGLAGIWHGAGFQFLIFGLLHGAYLVVNHTWRMYGPKAAGKETVGVDSFGKMASQVLLTYLAVLVAQVFFRAASTAQAVSLLSGMVGGHGFEHELPFPGRLVSTAGTLVNDLLRPLRIQVVKIEPNPFIWQATRIVLCFIFVWALPNTQQIMALSKPILGKMPSAAPKLLLWRPTLGWAFAIGTASIVVLLELGGTTEFLYFQF